MCITGMATVGLLGPGTLMLLISLFGLYMILKGITKFPNEVINLINIRRQHPDLFWMEFGAFVGYWLFAFLLLSLPVSLPWLFSLGH